MCKWKTTGAFLTFFVLSALLVAQSQPAVAAQSGEPAGNKADEKTGTFTCRDGSKTISALRVNDNYCDCADGSDEVNTSACIMIWGERLIQSGEGAVFKCRETGSFEQSIPLHWVNDGFCDCCDGSDENAGSVQCPNTCGEAARERADQLQKETEMRRIAAKTKGMMKKAVEDYRETTKKEIPRLEKQLVTVEAKLKNQQAVLDTLVKQEEEEREAVRKRYEKWEAEREKLQKGCIRWRQTVGCDALGRREAFRDAGCLDSIASGRSGFCECGELASPEDLSTQKKPSPLQGSSKDSVPLSTKKSANAPMPEETGLFDEDELSLDSEDVEDVEDAKNDNGENQAPNVKNRVTYNFTCDHVPFHCAYVCQNGGAVGAHKLPTEPVKPSGFFLPVATEARRLLANYTASKAEVTERLEEKKEELSRDVNTGDLLRTLKGQTFKFDFQDYTYELRPFEGTWQNQKNSAKGAQGPSMGRWDSFAENTYSSWAKDKFDYSRMHYRNGDRCWNGIVRTTEVHVVCGTENKLVHMEEPSMCHYQLVFESPAICED